MTDLETYKERDLVEFEGFGRVVVGAAADRLNRGVERAVGGHDDDRSLRRELARGREELELMSHQSFVSPGSD